MTLLSEQIQKTAWVSLKIFWVINSQSLHDLNSSSSKTQIQDVFIVRADFQWFLFEKSEITWKWIIYMHVCVCVQNHQNLGTEKFYYEIFKKVIPFIYPFISNMGFPGNSAGKESACNARDPSLISGSRRSPGEGIGYLLHYSWASLVVQMVKNLPAMWEIWVWSLGWEDPLEEDIATHSSILVWRPPEKPEKTEEPGRLQSMGVGQDWATKHSTYPIYQIGS